MQATIKKRPGPLFYLAVVADIDQRLNFLTMRRVSVRANKLTATGIMLNYAKHTADAATPRPDFPDTRALSVSGVPS
jgi:hypothetical protein